MPNRTEQLLQKIKTASYAIQKKTIDLPSLVGKRIERDSVTFEVVSLSGDTVTLSDVKTPRNQTTKMSVKAFLSKHIQEVTT